MTTDLSKLDPKDFGLEESSVATIEQAFQPKIIEKDALMSTYEALIAQELTLELCKDFHNLRMKFVKVRTGIADIHRTQKAFFLAAGRFVDAWKTKETLPVEQCEEILEKGEKHFERIEAKRIADLEISRTVELSAFTDILPQGLGQLSEASYGVYYIGAKAAHEARVEYDRKAEEIRIATEKAKAEEEAKIRADNERLKKEAQKREAEIAAERKRQAIKAAAERKRQEDLLAAERKKADEERKAQQLIIATEREKTAKIEVEKKAIAAAAKKAASAPDIDKLEALAFAIDTLPFPTLTRAETQKILADVKTLLNKTTKYLREKINTL